MSLIATEGFRTSHLLKGELWPEYAYCRSVVVYNGAAKTFKVGDVVAAAGGVPAAAANIVGVVLFETDAAASTNTNLVLLSKGPAIVSKAALNVGALVLADVVTKLESMGIQVNDSV